MPNEELLLVPGKTVTTRAALAAVYGGNTQAGIMVTSRKERRIFVFSDKSASKENSYTFDGRAEDDEYGPLYTYTASGIHGNQYWNRDNTALRDHSLKSVPVSLFISDGLVPGSQTKLQRYIGDVVVDPIKPFEFGWNNDPKGNRRRVIIFRLRPAPGATLVFDPEDDILVTPGGIELASPGAADALELVAEARSFAMAAIRVQPGIAPPENFSQKTAVQVIAAAERQVTYREAELRARFEAYLEALGHQYGRLRLRVEKTMLRTDTYDQTANVLYEVKALSDRQHVRQVVGQLMDYRRHAIHYVRDGLRYAALLPSEPSQDLKDLLKSADIELVYLDGTRFVGHPLPQ
ncbi:hypothetical protein ACFC1R_08360 [Kitasatospora sp. NPDC056138]|uniref:hypothetical protein n=1 Tax=Kitasatospora sp. NPDC056138 TaxID=3345724 RepID=UPI0035DCC41D